MFRVYSRHKIVKFSIILTFPAYFQDRKSLCFLTKLLINVRTCELIVENLFSCFPHLTRSRRQIDINRFNKIIEEIIICHAVRYFNIILHNGMKNLVVWKSDSTPLGLTHTIVSRSASEANKSLDGNKAYAIINPRVCKASMQIWSYSFPHFSKNVDIFPKMSTFKKKLTLLLAMAYNEWL